MWADCVAESDFTPTGESIKNVGPQWLNMHWVPVEPMSNSVSEPDESRHAWMYRGGVVPVKHDGDIPKCA